jgi:hypothetical protein
MPSNPPVVADLVAEVNERCALNLADAGQYLPGGLSPSILEGLRRGCKAVMLTLANPLVLQDSDVAFLSTFGVERVEDEAEMFALQRALAYWWRVAMKDQKPVSSERVEGGWRLEQKACVRARVAELKLICDVPYREPSDQIVVANRFGQTSPNVPPGSLPIVETPGVGVTVGIAPGVVYGGYGPFGGFREWDYGGGNWGEW